MTITTFLDLAELPNQTQDQSVFDKNMGNFIAKLPTLGREINETSASLNAIAAGGAYAIPYTLTAVNGSLGAGLGRLAFQASVNQNVASFISIDTTLPLSEWGDITSFLDTFKDSTSAIKGHITLRKVGDAGKFLTFRIDSIGNRAGIRDIYGAPIAASSANPFVAGDALMLFFQRTGDKGDTGPQSNYVLLSTDTVGAAVANIDRLNVFTSAYDKYVIELTGVRPSADNALFMRLADAGAVDTSANYTTMATEGGSQTAGQTALVVSAGASMSSTRGGSFTIEVRAANSTTEYKGISSRGSSFDGTNYRARLAEATYTRLNVVTGIRFYWSAGANFTAGTVRIYGIRNT